MRPTTPSTKSRPAQSSRRPPLAKRCKLHAAAHAHALCSFKEGLSSPEPRTPARGRWPPVAPIRARASLHAPWRPPQVHTELHLKSSSNAAARARPRRARRVAMKPCSPKHTSIAPPPSGNAPPLARHHAQCSAARSRSSRVRGLRKLPRAGRRELHPSPHRARAAGRLRTVGASRGERCVGAAPGAMRCGGDAWHGRGRRSRPQPLCAVSDMAKHTCAEPPGAHPREGAASGGAARPVAAGLVGVVSRPAGAVSRRYGPRGVADESRRVLGL